MTTDLRAALRDAAGTLNTLARAAVAEVTAATQEPTP
jgi:hypothetical protein